MIMKRLLLSLICCSPLLFSPSVSFSIDLLGPNDEKALSYEQYGPITSVETLWGIATKLRPDSSVSIQQTLVAIYKLNPYAFDKGNINKLIPESIIAVPSFDFILLQTDKEATALLNKYSAKKQSKKQVAETPVVKPVQEVEKAPIQEEAVDSIAASLPVVEAKTEEPAVEVAEPVIAENLIDKKELITLQNNIDLLQEELNVSSEQLIVATEMNQVLKQKLQPVQDELQLLNEQLQKELLVQKKLQQIIDDYKVQMDEMPLPPFSGEGLLNQILRTISSSLTNLLITILSPLLLMLSIFVLLMRIRSKRELDEQEQELAESTAILMEESGQFDALLTEDLSAEPEEELDFTKVESTEQVSTEEAVSISLDDEQELTLPSQSDVIDLTEAQENSSDVVDLTVEDEPEAVEHSEDDPFGIGALTEEEEVIATVDLDETETADEKEDDPFGIGALAEEKEVIATVDLGETETADEKEDDPFGIEALSEQEDLIASTDLDQEEVVSAEEQADLDLAAEWESQLSEQAGVEEVKQDDAAEQDESEVDLTVASKDVIQEEAETEISGLEAIAELELEVSDNSELAVEESAEQPGISDSSELAVEESAELELEVSDNSELAVEESAEQPGISDSSELAVEESAELELEVSDNSELAVEESAELPGISESSELAVESAELELELTAKEDATALNDLLDGVQSDKNDSDQHDLLAKQLSDVAFNEDAPLPKIEKELANDFIDIETLLESSDEIAKDELYSELDLDLGLEEFPDVVNSEQAIDIDIDENGIGAQLDLARAYLEIDDKAGAKEILLAVKEQSNASQLVEIEKLLSRL